jgi:hypothetical protein
MAGVARPPRSNSASPRIMAAAVFCDAETRRGIWRKFEAIIASLRHLELRLVEQTPGKGGEIYPVWGNHLLYIKYLDWLVRPRRLELPRPFGHNDLNVARLPVPPWPHDHLSGDASPSGRSGPLAQARADAQPYRFADAQPSFPYGTGHLALPRCDGWRAGSEAMSFSQNRPVELSVLRLMRCLAFSFGHSLL